MGQNAFYVWSVLKLVRRKHYKRDTVDNLIKDRESRYDDLLQYVSRSCNGFFYFTGIFDEIYNLILKLYPVYKNDKKR